MPDASPRQRCPFRTTELPDCPGYVEMVYPATAVPQYGLTLPAVTTCTFLRSTQLAPGRVVPNCEHRAWSDQWRPVDPRAPEDAL